MAQIPHGPENLFCPFIPPESIQRKFSFGATQELRRKPMAETCHVCPMWQQFRGTDKNTGKEVDEWRCAVSALPMLMIETASEVRQAGAATESFRNEVVKRADEARTISNGVRNQPLLINGDDIE